MRLKNILSVKQLIVLLLVFSTFFVFTQSAQAGYSGLSDRLPEETEGYRPNLHLTTGSNDSETGNGAFSPTTSIKVYTLDPSTNKTLNLNLASGSGCSDVNFTATVYSVVDSSNVISSGSNQYLSANSSCSDLTVTVPASSFTDSDISGRDGVFVAMVRLRLTTTSKSISLKASVDATTARIGYMGLYPSGSGPEDNSIPSATRLDNTAISVRGGSSQENYNVGVKFAAPCTYFGENLSTPKAVRMYWKDADSKTEVQDTPPDEGSPYNSSDNTEVRIRVFDLSNNDEQVVNQDADNENGLPSNTVRHVTFNVKYNHKYLVKFYGMKTSNGIRLWSPFDSAGADFNCKTETAGRTCTIDITSPTGPRPNSVVAGQEVRVRVKINAGNTATPPNGLPSTISALNGTPYTLRTHVNWNGNSTTSTQDVGSIAEGGSRDIDASLGNSPGVATYNINAYVYYQEAGGIKYNGAQYDGGDYFNGVHHSTDYDDLRGDFITCSVNTDSYSYFNITPSATNPVGTPDNENPESIDYRGSGSLDSNPYVSTVNSSYSTNLIIIRQAGGTSSLGTNSGNANFNTVQFPGPGTTSYNFDASATGRSYGSGTWQPGDQYCTEVTINNGRGWMGPAGPIDVVANTLRSPECSRIVNKPYVRMYGEDVFAGGSFPNGPNVNGSINTNYRATGVGSGVEYAAFALGNITGFPSSFLKESPPTGLFDLLNFASSPKGNFGATRTVTDYYSLKPDGIPTTMTMGDMVNNNQGSYSLTGNIEIGQGAGVTNMQINASKSIFVDGNVYISDNIVTKQAEGPGATWANANEIPHFSIIVRGNIYIAPGVTRIDGLLVAQPTVANNTGEIRTCTNSAGIPGNLTTTNGTDGECSNQLLFNGALVAKKIKWLRTHKTLSNALNGGRESYNLNSSAEIVNPSPDLYISEPAYLPRGGGTSGKYDSYQALPPIL